MVMGRLPESTSETLARLPISGTRSRRVRLSRSQIELDGVDHGGEADLHGLRLVKFDEVDQNVEFDTSRVIGVVDLPFRAPTTHS